MHEYYDPNDYMGSIHQEMDRDELELEVFNNYSQKCKIQNVLYIVMCHGLLI